MENKPKIAITIGDINGISAELIIKTFSDTRMLDFCIPIVYGHSGVMAFYRKEIKIEKFNYFNAGDISKIKDNTVNIINCWDEPAKIEMGKSDESTGKYALSALQKAVEDAKNGKIDAIVTAPINKNNMNQKDFPFNGHTEFFQHHFEAQESLMFMINDGLRVGLVTNHTPIEEVSKSISKKKIRSKLRLMLKSLQEDFAIDHPKIAVLGLNPHAGENGLLGKEEQEIIIPAIEEMKNEKKLVFGPYPADGFFGSQNYSKFDAILAMYHDQGLIPFKAITFGEGVNFTAGLPIVRTSPDHGTAYDIVGKDIASYKSFRQALFAAIDITKRRIEYKERSQNPLEKKSQKREWK